MVNVAAARLRTVTVTGADVLPVKLPSPPYAAVIVCEPGARPFTVSVTVAAFAGAVPRTTPPSRNSTEPVGCPAAGATGPTFAVSVTGCSTSTVDADAVTEVVVLPGVTVSAADAAVDAIKAPAPEKDAPIAAKCTPAAIPPMLTPASAAMPEAF